MVKQCLVHMTLYIYCKVHSVSLDSSWAYLLRKLSNIRFCSNVKSHSRNANALTISDQRGVALVSLASIHPTRNEINTRE